MYQGASPDGECPLVVDSSTPSCGDSRFGCWVCTLVEQDKSMAAMIQNDEEKEWMLPLLELRNELDVTDDRHLRDFRRITGGLTLHNDRLVHGPYTQAVREHWLRRLLKAQRWVRDNGPKYVRGIELITMPELQEIRRIWVTEKHEIEDSLPGIYVETMGQPYPGPSLEEAPVFSAEDMALLREVAGDDLHFQLARDLLDVERRFRAMARRADLYKELEKSLRRGFYANEEDATQFALAQHGAHQSIRRAREERDHFAQLPLLDMSDGP
jgi:DNA sulfur modification protein DndC